MLLEIDDECKFPTIKGRPNSQSPSLPTVPLYSPDLNLKYNISIHSTPWTTELKTPAIQSQSIPYSQMRRTAAGLVLIRASNLVRKDWII